MKTESVTLVAVESAEQAGFWAKHAQQSESTNATVVALSAEADEALETLQIPHTTLEDFYGERDLLKAAAQNNTIVFDLCRALDEILEIDFSTALPRFSSYFYAPHLRPLYDCIFRSHFCLTRLLNQLQPTNVVLFAAPLVPPTSVLIRSKFFLSRVLTELAQGRGMTVERHSAMESDVSELADPVTLRSLAKRLRDIVVNARIDRASVASAFWPGMPREKLGEAGIKVASLPKARTHSASSDISLAGLAGYFTFEGDDLSALALPHLRYFVDTLRVSHLAYLTLAEKILRRRRVGAIVATAPLAIEATASLVAARRADIPAIILQHGGFNGYADWSMLELTDLLLPNIIWSFGDGVTETLQPLAEKRNPVRKDAIAFQTVGYGVAHRIRLTRGRTFGPSGKPKVIYVPASLPGSSRYLSGHHRADIAYWRLQRRIMKRLTEATDLWEVHVRPPPRTQLSHHLIDWLARHDTSGITVHHKTSFADLAATGAFDLIITDAPTTVLLEAASTDARLIVYFDPASMHLRPEAAILLERRATVPLNVDAYVAAIDQELVQQRRRDNSVDDSFLLKYCLSDDARDPAERQVEAVLGILYCHK